MQIIHGRFGNCWLFLLLNYVNSVKFKVKHRLLDCLRSFGPMEKWEMMSLPCETEKERKSMVFVLENFHWRSTSCRRLTTSAKQIGMIFQPWNEPFETINIEIKVDQFQLNWTHNEPSNRCLRPT